MPDLLDIFNTYAPTLLWTTWRVVGFLLGWADLTLCEDWSIDR